MENKITINCGVLTGSELMKQLKSQVISLDKEIKFDEEDCIIIPLEDTKVKKLDRGVER